MKKEISKLTIILSLIITILLIVLGYGVYTGFRVKAMISSLETQVQQLTTEKNNLTSQLDALQHKYNLLEQDVSKIYKTCMKENVCKGRFPLVSWDCNNIGDEVNNPSHICFCDNDCNLNATQISH
jgi:hypothetical protein